MPIIGTIGAPIIGGALGSLFGGGDRNAEQQALQNALNQLAGVNVPGIQQQMVDLQQLQDQGQISPQLEQQIQQQSSQMNGISTDPRLKQAQMQALAQMQQIGNTGLNATDRQALMQARLGTDQAAQANQASIMQNMAMRGQAGSGNELAARLAASQAGTNSASNQGLDVASQAQARALQAMSQAGSMAGNIRNQDFGQQADVARAQDAINAFNTQQRIANQQRNVGAQNQAQYYNLGEKQRVSDSNAGIANQQELHNKGLYQQQYQDQLSKAGAMAGQYNTQAGQDYKNAQNTSNMWSNIGQGAGKGFAGLSQYMSTPAAPTASETDYTDSSGGYHSNHY